MNRLKWAAKEFQWLGIRTIHFFTKKYYVNKEKYAGVGMHSAADGNDYISMMIAKGEPFAVGRVSFSEFGFMACAESERLFNSKIHYKWTPSYISKLDHIKINGDSREGLMVFDKLMRKSVKIVDAIACFPTAPMADAVLESCDIDEKKYLFEVDAIYPFVKVEEVWTKTLKGKRVLVVCPFADLMREQQPFLHKIWPHGEMPEFELLTDPSIFYNWFGVDDKYENWHEAYLALKDRVLQREFDVALLGCGTFGFPLAAEIKESGRQAVHMGGAVQLLFGIKGKRWDSFGYYNDFWVRAGAETKPWYAEKLEGATYW